MKSKSKQQELKRELRVINKIYPLGWIPQGNFRFLRNGKLYDLSASDISQLDRIEKQGLFLIN